MPSKKKVAVNKLSDVQVDTVGLVSYGANNEEFFLLKSQEEVTTMPDLNEEQVTPEAIEDVVAKAIEKMLPEALAKAVPPQPPEVEEVGDERLEALEKANQVLLERLEKAEAQAAAEREAREKAEIVRKVGDAYSAFPVKAEVLGEHLYRLYKSDQAEYKFFADLFTALSKQMRDGDLFAEIGADAESVGDEANLEEIAKTGSAEEIKKAFATMSRTQAEKYLAAKRKAIKESGR